MNTSKDGKEMRSLMERAKEALKSKIRFMPAPKNVTVWTVEHKFEDYDKVYEYNEQNLKLVIPQDIVHGNYRFGYIDEDGCFIVFYIGRADNGLLERMQEHWTAFSKNEEFDMYKECDIYFSFVKQDSAENSYHCECEEYHRFDDGKKGLGAFLNKYHPAIPKDSDEHCPICGVPNN